MSKIFLVNVGANTAHGATARSPIFDDESFVFVSFPHSGTCGVRPYSAAARPCVRGIDIHDTHNDPDWQGLTYGDGCDNPRASALRNVVEDDILLFWGLLWRNSGKEWDSFTGERGWYLIGVLRVREILEAGQRPANAKPSRIARARRNVHFYRGELDPGNRVFIGCTRYSRLFPVAVNLEVGNRSGLLYTTIRTAKGTALRLGAKPDWNSSLRSCRPVWDLSDPKSRALAHIARDRIYEKTGYDLLSGLR